MKGSQFFSRVKVFATTAVLFAAANANAAAFGRRSRDDGDVDLIVRIAKWLFKACGDVLTNPGG